MGWLATFHLVP